MKLQVLRLRISCRPLILALALAPLCMAVHAGPAGELDPGFGDAGRLKFSELFQFPELSSAHTVAQQPADGKLVVGGDAWTDGSATDFGVVRLSPDGTVDQTFGTAGLAKIDFNGKDDYLTSLAIQPDGRIVVAGTAGAVAANSTRLAIARLEADGSVDTSFGSAGLVKIDLGEVNQRITGIAIDPQGRIAVTGYVSSISEGDAVFLRFRTDGSLDTSFGTGSIPGITRIDSGLDDWPAALVRQSDGGFVACGTAWSGDWDTYHSQMLALRVDVNGVPDAGFGSGGVWLSPLNDRSSEANDCVLLPDGDIVLAGYEHTDRESDLVVMLARLHPEGSLNAGAWNAGIATFPAGGEASRATAVVTLDDGGLALTGAITHSRLPSDLFVARVDMLTGLPDPDFGAQGVTVFDFGRDYYYTDAWGHALLQQADGKLVVAGRNAIDEGIGGYHEAAMGRVDPYGSGSPGYIGLTERWGTAIEDDGEALISVRRTGGSLGAVQTDYRARSSFNAIPSASAVSDFSAVSGTLTWSDGDMQPKLISVPLVDDDVNENLETFEVVLSNATTKLTLSETLVQINDHDPDAVPIAPPAGPSPPVTGPVATRGGGGAFGLVGLLCLAGTGLWRRTRGQRATGKS